MSFSVKFVLLVWLDIVSTGQQSSSSFCFLGCNLSLLRKKGHVVKLDSRFSCTQCKCYCCKLHWHVINTVPILLALNACNIITTDFTSTISKAMLVSLAPDRCDCITLVDLSSNASSAVYVSHAVVHTSDGISITDWFCLHSTQQLILTKGHQYKTGTSPGQRSFDTLAHGSPTTSRTTTRSKPE